MLSELTVVEQRYLAVREVLDTGATVTDVARRYGVDRRTESPGNRSRTDLLCLAVLTSQRALLF